MKKLLLLFLALTTMGLVFSCSSKPSAGDAAKLYMEYAGRGQYDLFLHLACSYSEAELARFFYPILRASDDFKAFVSHNYANGDSLQDIAGKANLSKSYFMRRFKEDFGMTAHQWLVEQKKQELVRMISGGQTHTKTIAEALGFGDLAGLYQFCRKHFGCSITTLMDRIAREREQALPVGG